MATMEAPSQRRWHARLAISVGVSLFVHAVLYGLLFGVGFDKPLIELQIPSEVELGLLVGDGEPAPAPAPPPPPPPKPEQKKKKRVEERVADPFADSPPTDAGLAMPDMDDDFADAAVATATDAGVFNDASVAVEHFGDGNTLGATGDGFGVGAGGHGLGGFAPPGAQIGMHIDLDLLREHFLNKEANMMLGMIPEWRKLLRGSGIDPLDTRALKRVFVGTPNFQRSHLVVAASFVGGVERFERAVARLAGGNKLAWSTLQGYRVAPWNNRGPTERVIAFVAQDQLVITRKSDLPRVLAVAREMGRRSRKQGMQGVGRGAAGLLGMFKDEAVAVSIEDLPRFVVGRPRGLPKSVRVSMTPADDEHAALLVRARYEEADAAEAALRFAEDELRQDLLDRITNDLQELNAPLREAKLSRDDRQVTAEVLLTMHEIQKATPILLNLLRPKQ